MGLILLKGRDGGYLRAWYAIMSINGKRTSRALKTPLRGRIPTDGEGRFSLALTGDAAFEKSKADALAELKAENQERREGGASARRNAEALGVRTLRISDLADENAKRKRYALVEGSREYKYNKSVHDILAHFANWNASRPKGKGAKRCNLLSDVSGELVREYYAEISKSQSWQTFRKYVFILKSVFRYFTGGAITNPFEVEYAEYKGSQNKSEFGDKAEVAHRPPDIEQLRRAWEYARSLTNKPYLYRLAVVAACSGLRIGDCCNLEWDNVDLQGVIDPKVGPALHDIKTRKTGSVISVPIYDYDPDNLKDYNPVLGELRRELEAALAEREDGAKYVIPEAARIYGYNPSRIIEEGKDIFAHAIAEENAPEAALLVGEEPKPKTPAEILKEIDAATFAQPKRERVRLVYEMFATGKTYSQIAQAIGKNKAAVCADLATVEQLTGQKVRKGASGTSERSKRLKLIEATRQSRGQGKRAACLYGWHSCRMFFVGYAFYEIGLEADKIMGITGHKTLSMVRHYTEMSSGPAVAAAKRLNAERNYKERMMREENARNATGRARTRLDAPETSGAAVALPQGEDAPQDAQGAAAATPSGKSPAERLRELKSLFEEGSLPHEVYMARCAEIAAEI